MERSIAESHRSLARRRRHGNGSYYRRLGGGGEDQLSAAPSTPPGAIQSLPPDKSLQQAEAQHWAGARIDCQNAPAEASAPQLEKYSTRVGQSARVTRPVTSGGAGGRHTATCSPAGRSGGADASVSSPLTCSCTGVQLAGTAMLSGSPNLKDRRAAHIVRSPHHAICGLPPSAFVPFPALRPVQDQLHYPCSMFLEPSELLGEIHSALRKVDSGPGSICENNTVDTPRDLHVHTGKLGIQDEPVERPRSASIPSRRDKLGSAWIRLIRAGSKLFGVKRNRCHSSVAVGRPVAEEKASRLTPVRAADSVVTSSASPPVSSMRRRFSLPAFMSAANNSRSGCGGSKRRWPWRGEARRRHASVATTDSNAVTGTVPDAKTSCHLVEQAPIPVPVEVAANHVAPTASKREAVVERMGLEEEPTVRPITASHRDAVVRRREHRPKLCWRKPVLPVLRGAFAAPAGVQRPSNDEISDTSFVVVSLASGENSPTGWGGGARCSSGASEGSSEAHEFLTAPFSKAAEIDAPNDESASAFSVTIVPHMTTTPHSRSKLETPQASQCAAYSNIEQQNAKSQGQLCSVLGELQASSENSAENDATMPQQTSEGIHGRRRSACHPKPCGALERQMPASSGLLFGIDTLVPSEHSTSEFQVSICQSHDDGAPLLDRESCGVPTPRPDLQAAQLLAGERIPLAWSPRVVSPRSGQHACGTMQFCSLPDVEPLATRGCLFSESACLEASGFPLEGGRLPAHAAELNGAAKADSTDREMDSCPVARMHSSDMLSTVTARRDESRRLSIESMSRAPELPTQWRSPREMFGETRGNVLIETDDEGPLTLEGLSPDRPKSPCSPPLGISIPQPAAVDNKEPGSLQQSLTALWDELEAAHKRGSGLPVPPDAARLPSVPELDTWELFPLPDDTQAPYQHKDSVVFSKSAAHSTFMSMLGGLDSTAKTTTHVAKPTEPRNSKLFHGSASKAATLQRRSTEGNYT